MENLQYAKILKTNWDVVALIIGITIVLTLIISLVQPFQYSATTKLLIIQKQELNTDAYTATKSAERIGQNLANIVFTSSFYNEVIDANSSIKDKFSLDSTERRKAWEKNVKINVLPETGILEIQVFDIDRNFATQLANSIAYVLVDKGAEYHGGGNSVEIKVVDDVFISKYPVRPNIILNSGLALLVGFLLGSAFVVLNEAKKIREKQEILKGITNQYENIDNNWQLDKNAVETSFGFKPDLEFEEAPIVQDRKIEIKTMYDHLK